MAARIELPPLDIDQCWPITGVHSFDPDMPFEIVSFDGGERLRASEGEYLEADKVRSIPGIIKHIANMPALGRLTEATTYGSSPDGYSELPEHLNHLDEMASFIKGNEQLELAFKGLRNGLRKEQGKMFRSWIRECNLSLNALKCNAYVRLVPWEEGARSDTPGVLAKLRGFAVGGRVDNYLKTILQLSGKDDVLGTVPPDWRRDSLYLPPDVMEQLGS